MLAQAAMRCGLLGCFAKAGQAEILRGLEAREADLDSCQPLERAGILRINLPGLDEILLRFLNFAAPKRGRTSGRESFGGFGQTL